MNANLMKDYFTGCQRATLSNAKDPAALPQQWISVSTMQSQTGAYSHAKNF